MFAFVSAINRDVSRGVARAIFQSVDDASFTGLFDSIAAVLAQQFVLAPYYFALFHQNKERHLLRQITGRPEIKDAASMKVALFTDTLEEVNGVARFVRDMAAEARKLGRPLTVITCATEPKYALPNRRNFVPLLTKRMPLYQELPLNLPPVLEVLEWADRQQFDAVHVSTPGPMGLCGWLVSKMLRVPMLGTYHTDFPAYMNHLTRDHRVVNGCVSYMKWLYGQMPAVYSRSKSYLFSLHDLGLPDARLRTLPPAIDTERFNPQRRDPNVWVDHRVSKPLKLLYAGRVSVEKNLPMLVETFKRLCAKRSDVALVVAGDGPYLPQMKAALAGLPAHFLGYQNDRQLPPLYAAADLLVFPSRTDTLGQVVMEAQACGLPAVVGNEGGPKEVVADGQSGLVIPSNDPGRWADAIDELLSDAPRRQWMASNAPQRVNRLTLADTFDAFWQGHADAVMPKAATPEEDDVTAAPSSARLPA
jgi:glycosyltransferase involved in cell wall biosynthesis